MIYAVHDPYEPCYRIWNLENGPAVKSSGFTYTEVAKASGFRCECL